MSRTIVPDLKRFVSSRLCGYPEWEAKVQRQLRALLSVASAVGRAKRHAWLDREALEQAMERAFVAYDRLEHVSGDRK